MMDKLAFLNDCAQIILILVFIVYVCSGLLIYRRNKLKERK